jgi:septal ring factor EnvC (AmiA/AmiB activator)
MNLEMEKSAEYQKSLESAINAKDAYIAQLETAVSESRERLEQCETKINEMASMLETIESAPPAKKKRGLLSDR